jgi:hypothetical protein
MWELRFVRGVKFERHRGDITWQLTDFDAAAAARLAVILLGGISPTRRPACRLPRPCFSRQA